MLGEFLHEGIRTAVVGNLLHDGVIDYSVRSIRKELGLRCLALMWCTSCRPRIYTWFTRRSTEGIEGSAVVALFGAGGLLFLLFPEFKREPPVFHGQIQV